MEEVLALMTADEAVPEEGPIPVVIRMDRLRRLDGSTRALGRQATDLEKGNGNGGLRVGDSVAEIRRLRGEVDEARIQKETWWA